VSVDRGPVTASAYLRIRCWRAEWQQLRSPDLPIVLADGATLTGLDAVRRLGKEITYAKATPEPELEDPRRYPRVSGRPPAGWVSQFGVAAGGTLTSRLASMGGPSDRAQHDESGSWSSAAAGGIVADCMLGRPCRNSPPR